MLMNDVPRFFLITRKAKRYMLNTGSLIASLSQWAFLRFKKNLCHTIWLISFFAYHILKIQYLGRYDNCYYD